MAKKDKKVTTISDYTASIFGLEGKTALVTGGSTGIGFMITHALVSAGAKVYIASRKLEACQKAVQSLADLPGSCIPFAADRSAEAGRFHQSDSVPVRYWRCLYDRRNHPVGRRHELSPDTRALTGVVINV